MKRWIALLLMGALMTGCAALGETTVAPTELPEAVIRLIEKAEAAQAREKAERLPDPEDLSMPDPEDLSMPDSEDLSISEPEGTSEPLQTCEVWFEEGFALSIPEGWMSYPVSEEDREKGIVYALGDGTGEHYLYIQSSATDLASVEEISSAVMRQDALTRTGDLTFDGVKFTAFIDNERNVSCCATLWNGRLLLFMFTPQTDSDFMLTATQLMESFVKS